MSNKSNISPQTSGCEREKEESGHEVAMLSYQKKGFEGKFRCSRCRGTHFWVGVTGARVCVFCLPPKTPDAVVKWIDSSEAGKT